jgi:hypothetical protein
VALLTDDAVITAPLAAGACVGPAAAARAFEAIFAHGFAYILIGIARQTGYGHPPPHLQRIFDTSVAWSAVAALVMTWPRRRGPKALPRRDPPR